MRCFLMRTGDAQKNPKISEEKVVYVNQQCLKNQYNVVADNGDF